MYVISSGKEEGGRVRLAKPGVGPTLIVSTWKDGTGGRPDIEAILGSTVILVSKHKEIKRREDRRNREERKGGRGAN